MSKDLITLEEHIIVSLPKNSKGAAVVKSRLVSDHIGSLLSSKVIDKESKDCGKTVGEVLAERALNYTLEHPSPLNVRNLVQLAEKRENAEKKQKGSNEILDGFNSVQ